MKLNIVLYILIVVFTSNNLLGQELKKHIKISGKVTDINGKPFENAIIFIDSIKTNVKTNRKGVYKIKSNLKIKSVAVFVENLGLLEKKYEGERKINFVFRGKNDQTLTENLIIGLGYKTDIEETRNNFSTGADYSDFANIYEIFNRRFPFVTVRNGQIKIGKGPNSFNGNTEPLILIDNQRVNQQILATLPTNEIKSIKVIRRGSEAAEYGSLKASNGVILITLKK